MSEFKVELTVFNKDFLNNYEEGEPLTIKIVPTTEITYKHDTSFGAYLAEALQDVESKEINIIDITGNFIRPLDLGQSYVASGIITVYRNKKQLKVEEIRKILPKDKRGVISFLRSFDMGHMADILYDEYGVKALDVIRDNPLELVSKWPALYDEKVLGWQEKIINLKDDYECMIRLMGYGIKAAQAKELYDKFGDLIFTKLAENPYFLSHEISGYSFKKCDNVAKNIGIHPENTQRLCEGSMYVLGLLSIGGDTYTPYNKFLSEVKEELNIKIGIMEIKRIYKSLTGSEPFIYKYGEISFPIDQMVILDAMNRYKSARTKNQKEACKITIFEVNENKIKEALTILKLEERLVIDADRVFKKSFYEWEIQIAHHINILINGDVPVPSPASLDEVLSSRGIVLEQKQMEAVIAASSTYGGITIIDGSAGCGKTFCMKIALDLIEQNYRQKAPYFEKVILAPTGKASKVAQKATGIQSFTIHKALCYNPSTFGFFYNAKNPLPYDCIVVDECSMIDTELACNLFAAISPMSKVILMGDTKQLPSIGAGNVLKDLIESNKLRHITLDVVKRQGVDSGIVANARNIINGIPMTTQKELMDAVVYKGNDDEDAANKMFKIITKMLEQYKLRDIQVLSPQKTGATGTNYLNFILQEKFNPDNNDIRFLNKSASVEVDDESLSYDLFFKKGDKVINTRNDYKRPWYNNVQGKLTVDNERSGVTNGEAGTVVKLIKSNETSIIVVRYDDKYILYENDFSDLEHAYALTIHKSQGSEWPCVILMLMINNRLMLDRNLLYTGYTRARVFNATITTPYIMQTCINTQNNLNRNTALKDRILETCA